MQTPAGPDGAPAPGRLRIERRGGIAGLKLAAEHEVGRLSPGQRAALDTLLATPPAPAAAPAAPTRGIPTPADRFRYRITSTGADGATVVRDVDEGAMPAALQALCPTGSSG